MRALLFLALFALATQVQMSEITEFYGTFVSNIPMDFQTKNRIMNDGLDCINMATNTLINSVRAVQQDVATKDLIHLIRNVIGSAEVLEKNVLPKCALTYMELTHYLNQHADHSQIDSHVKLQLFQARLIQLMGKTILDAAGHDSNAVAKDLAILVDTAFGLIDANLPTLKELDYSKYVSFDEQRAIPLFFKGFFTTLGLNDMAKINATSQCVLGVVSSIKTLATNPAMQRGDFYTRANTFLDSLMPVTDAFERCQRLNTVDMAIFKRFITMIKEYPIQSFMRITANYVLELPTIIQTEYNMSIELMEGQYELAGKLYAMTLRTVYNGIMF